MENKVNGVILLLMVSIVIMFFLAGGLGESNDVDDASDKAVGVDSASVKSLNYKTIIIDAGHGGMDPGKVSDDGILEKDINLKIAHRLKLLLEQNDFNVIMTRETDAGLYQDSDSNKKSADLQNRVKLINESQCDLAISIHQNSFTQESSRGAQVFYYTTSEEGKNYAKLLQEVIRKSIDDGNKRLEKANDTYFMLKKVSVPYIIVECGFLSNYEEAALLVTKEYQDKMAWAIHLGIIQYLNQITESAK